MTIRKPAVVVSIAAAVAALSACSPMADNNFHGTVETSSTVSIIRAVPAVPAVPVAVTGNGEQVVTADLVASGYAVHYQATSWTLIVAPVQADGSEGTSLINAMGQDTSGGVIGSTTYRATGRTTLHVSNTRGPWRLTFTPLS